MPDWANKNGAVGIGGNTTLGGTNGLNLRTYVSPTFGISANLGFDGNIYGSSDVSAESAVMDLGLYASYKLAYWQRGHLALTLGLSEKIYEDAPASRKGADNRTHNYFLGTELIQEFGDGFYFSNILNLDYGNQSDIFNNDITTGIRDRSRVWLRSDTSIYYRPDRKDLDAPGVRFRGRHQFSQYNQSGDNYLDTLACIFGLDAENIINPNLRFWGGASLVDRRWGGADLDSQGYRVEGGVAGKFPCGALYRLGLSHEYRDYDSNNIDDRDTFGYSLLVTGNISDIWRWGVYSNYGFMDPNLPNSSRFGFADAKGKRYGSYIQREFGDAYLASLFCYGLYLDGDIFDSQKTEAHYVYSGLSVEKTLGERSSAGLTVGYQTTEYEWGNSRNSQDAFFAKFFWRKEFGIGE